MSVLSAVVSFLPLFVSTFVAIVVIKFVVGYLKQRKYLNKLGGPPDLLFIGNAHQLPSRPSDLRRKFQEWVAEYRDRFSALRFWVGTIPYIVFFEPKTVEALIHSTKHLTKSAVYDHIIDWLGFGLLTSAGAKWKSRRRLLTPAFHFNIVNDFLPIYNEQARVFVEKVGVAGERPDDIFNLVTRCTLDIICETAMGIKMDTQSNKNTEYLEAVHSLSAIAVWRTRVPWIVADLLYPLLPICWKEKRQLKLVKTFTRKVIESRRQELRALMSETGTFPHDDVTERSRAVAFLTLLLRAQMERDEISDDGIQEEVDTFMFEGHDTTSSGITWAIQMIGMHPEIQEKLHAEVDEVFGDSDRDADADDLKRLTYLSCVLKEVLRLCPPVPIIGRRLTEDVEIGGIKLPEGMDVFIFIYSLHRDPVQFPDPEKFDPDRFLPENMEGRHPYAYIPFSAGPRNCIGQKFAQLEEKVVMSWLLRRYTWSSRTTFEQLEPTIDLILRPSEKLNITIKPRNASR